MKTSKELRDARAVQLNTIDDIIRTAREAGRALTDEEIATHDAAVALVEGPDGFDEQITRAEAQEASDEIMRASDIRRARYEVPNINVRGHRSIKQDRSLDELLWATHDVVRASNGLAWNPVDQVIVRSGNDLLCEAPRITAWNPDDREVLRAFQDTVADMVLFGFLTEGENGVRNSKQAFEVARTSRQFKDRYINILRAMDVDTSAQGTEWVPTGIGASLHEAVRASGKVAPLFQRIDLPTNPWKWPLAGADATAYRVAEPTADNESAMSASTPGTGAATFDAEIFGARVLYSLSLEADSAVAVTPYVRKQLVQAFVDAEEKAILDGDSDATHQDSDVEAIGDTDVRTAFDGLRKKALAQTVATATTCSAANLGAVRAAMGKWGVNPSDLAFIIGVSNYHDLVLDSTLLTVDKMGPQATILNGQIGSVHGVPVIVSEHVREAINASGVADGITSTKTYMLCVNRNEWAIGQRMALDIKTDNSKYVETYQTVMVAFQREDLQHIGTAATNDDTSIAFNVTP